MAPLGVYIHFPWCRTLCPYCDFPRERLPDDPALPERYARAVADELAERAAALAGRELVSIYFGGGTPSLWGARHVGGLIDAVAGAFGAARDGLEITLEANPRDCSPERLAGWREAGVDRLSIGVQSLSAGRLVTLGRDHGAADAAAALAAAAAAGFARRSADLILGVPDAAGPPAAAVRPGPPEEPDALAVADAGAPHLSIYELTIKPGTPLHAAVAAGRLRPLDDDELAARYLAVDAALTARGYQHYEVSSYARPGHRAVHNQLYWRGDEYLGLGAGAASFQRQPGGGGRRWTNRAAPADYLAARGEGRVAERETVDPEALRRDLLWLGMRTADGVETAALAGFERLVADWKEHHLVVEEGGRIRPTVRGFLFADRIASAIVAGRRYTADARPPSPPGRPR